MRCCCIELTLRYYFVTFRTKYKKFGRIYFFFSRFFCKMRGYIYKLKNDHNFKCHNCGVSRTFTNFLKDIDAVLYDQYVMERYKNGLTGKGSQTKTPEFKFEKPDFSKKSFDLPTISELNKEHLARQYLENRKIPKEYFRDLYFCQNFKEWTNTQKHTFDNLDNDEPRIIIPLINQGKIFC